MAPDLNTLLAQRAALDEQIKAAQVAVRAQTIETIRTLMAQAGLTVADLAPPPVKRLAKPGKSTGKVAPKYRDPASGATWSGRGFQPVWLRNALAAGRRVEEFAIVD